MKSAIAASAFIGLTAAQWPGAGTGAGYGTGNPYASFGSCLSNCTNEYPTSATSFSDMCKNTTAIDAINSCISSSSCDSSDKSKSYQGIAQACADAGVTVSAKPEATFSATSGGSAWPSGWSTNSAWASYTTGAPSGWNGASGYGPFGAGASNGWGPWASESTGSWTDGPWTSWWGSNGCPPSTWSGWTSGSWSHSAPWTSWSGCTASTTATSTYTTTMTSAGTTATVTTTGYGYQVEAVSSATASSTKSGSGAMPTNFLFAGSAAGAVGVLAGAILL